MFGDLITYHDIDKGKYETRTFEYLHSSMCSQDGLSGYRNLAGSSPLFSVAHTRASLSRPIKMYGIYEICCRVKCIRNTVVIPPATFICSGKLEACETSLEEMAPFTSHPTIMPLACGPYICFWFALNRSTQSAQICQL
jgi:hypothetical protein